MGNNTGLVETGIQTLVLSLTVVCAFQMVSNYELEAGATPTSPELKLYLANAAGSRITEVFL